MEASEINVNGCHEKDVDDISELPPSANARRAPGAADYFDTGRARSTKPYACVDCRYATDRKNNLRRHRATMHERCDRALECCGLTFVSKSELREHVSENHGSGAGYACTECGRRFGRRALMRRHAAVHDERPTTTDDRTRRRAAPSGLSTGRRYACTQCDYTTGHKSNLDRHFRRHTAPVDIIQSPFTGDNKFRYLPANNSSDDSEPMTLTSGSVNHGDFSVPLSSCYCQICLCSPYYRRQLAATSASSSWTTSLFSRAPPFMFSLLPSGLENLAWSFRESVLPGRRLWSVYARDHGSSTETNKEHCITTDTAPGDISVSKDGDERQVEVGGVRESDDRPTLSASSAGDRVSDGTESDVTGTCYERRRRLRLLPLLHTCRSCSLTFVSQLQLKSHSDVFHRATEHDLAASRPICCRAANKPDPQPLPPLF